MIILLIDGCRKVSSWWGQYGTVTDYGINESCRFGGATAREKKKWECRVSGLFAAIDALLYACISTSAPLVLLFFSFS